MNNNIGFNNKAWGRSNNSPNIMNQAPMQPQLMNQSGLGNMGTGMVQFPSSQQAVFQNMGLQQQNLGLGLQQMANNAISATLNSQMANNPIFQQVTYPNTRGLNPTAFQTNLSLSNNQNNAGSGKQRVFTGKVTQMHDNFGLVDEEVMFQMNVCVKGSHPIIGDRVLVEAQYTPNMPFKWNATRIQVLSGNQSRQSKSYGNNYAVPPQTDRNRKGGRRDRSRERDDDEVDRKRRREERMREREKDEKKSPISKRTKSRSRSPKSVRRRTRVIPRYMVQVPKIDLDLEGGDVLEIKRRYKNMYIPSDFFYTSIKWVESFPANKPFAINKPCSFHVMNKEVESTYGNTTVDPPDADYLFSAKVMLMSTPGLEEIYQKCCALAEDKDADEKDYVHPTRLINFLVGLRGKNETMAIGGAWSPSLDGENPDKDPSVLIKTAIRTCKSLTGIDLSNCTQWYRFLELYYRRSESTHKGKTITARVETVVLFLPDVWSCLPTRLEWDELHAAYRKQLESILNQSEAVETVDDVSSPADEKEEEPSGDKIEPTHYSQLDPKNMVVNELRNELKARNINYKGLKSQLVARLQKCLKSEAVEKSEDKEKLAKEGEAESDVSIQEIKKNEIEEKKIDEKEKALLQKRYTLPEIPHIVVHPSKTAKSGKFDCTTMSLSLLLDYRPEDSKEHSFEVSLFAELFNEMLSRDFGFNIFKSLYELPEKKEEKKEDKKEKKDKDEDKKEKKKDEVEKTEEKDGEIKEEMDIAELEDIEKKEDAGEEKNSEDKKFDKERKNGKDDKKKDESGDESEESEKKRKERDRKKRDKVKLYTEDRHLLLSFVYFDQTQCGYIFDKDMEDLLYTLGLKMSRAQVKKLISKVIVRDSLHYRKLTDKPKEGEGSESIDGSLKDVNWDEIAQGNKKLLPIFYSSAKPKSSQIDQSSEPSTTESFVKFRGSIVDVGKLMSQLERSEKTRLETEARMVDLKIENQKISDKYHKSSSTIKHLNSELREYKDKLRSSEDVLGKISAHSKLFQQTLVDIKDKIEPVLKSTSYKDELKKERDDKDRDKKLDDGKSRWEKDKEYIHSKKEENNTDVDIKDIKNEKDE